MPLSPVRILFQGDSLTDAFRRPEERNPAYQLGNGFAFLVASHLAYEFPGCFEFLNRGVSGQTVGELADRWQEDVLDLGPDVVSLLIGVNSTIRSMSGEEQESVEAFEDKFAALISRTFDSSGEAQFILVEPFLLKVGDVNDRWCTHLRERQEVIKHLALRTGSLFVPTQAAFDTAVRRAPPGYWAYDGIHPTHAGAEVLARCWLDVVNPSLDFWITAHHSAV